MKALTVTIALALSMISFSYGETSPEKTSAIKAMFQITGMDKQMTGGFEAMLPVVNQLSAQLQLNSEEAEELKTIYRDWFEHDVDRQLIIDKIIELYDEAFTIEEIQILTDFYKTPTGQKFIKQSPELMKAAAEVGMQEAQNKQCKLMERLQSFIEKRKK
ncbi:MAG: DUF2059 domain-containing protein [Kiritimatiellaceae bacterium]|nr:DUF2059 domain-containing protein [Kiritimatiellaceae bacterium]